MGVVDVDVGGTHFRTTEATLKKLPFFENLLECDGPLFVDRSPEVFERVLEFLRTGQVKLAADRPGYKLDSDRVKEEIRFYGLDPDAVHVDIVQPDVVQPEQHVVYFQNILLSQDTIDVGEKRFRTCPLVRPWLDDGWRIRSTTSLSEEKVGAFDLQLSDKKRECIVVFER